MPTSRRLTPVALLIVSALTLVGCGSDDEPSEPPASSATEAEQKAPEPDDEPAADASEPTEDDTSLADFLRSAKVDDALVNRLGEVGDANGYGLGEGVETSLEERQQLATVQVGTCRDVAVGHRTWEGIQASDVSSGGTEEQAAAMADFLRKEFCPHVAPYKEAPLPEQTLGGPEEDAKEGRGLASPVSWWDTRYRRVSWSEECAAQTGQPIGDPVAYRLSDDAVVCATVPPAEKLKKHLISVDVVFAEPVGEERAQDAALSLLPIDAVAEDEAEGTNPDWSYLEGACLNLNIQSQRLKDIVADLEKDAEPWAHAVYYSDGSTTDGAVGPYTGKIKQVSLSTGRNEPTDTGDLTC
ncbi:hypothetical protein ACFZAG_08235 [Streptomyces sp. NPDC012403]|uniref:hypothetical protein n=1 Tax=unclassified Streptomyces TaxID=2593676 RepID=UPI001C24C1A1|nr:hypothetical protein [Streptomyces sp. AC558_RSS880]